MSFAQLKILDSVAQLVEQYTFNVWVLGSNPSGITSLTWKELKIKVSGCSVAQCLVPIGIGKALGSIPSNSKWLFEKNKRKSFGV